LLGQPEGRTGAAVIDWLRERTPQFRDAIEFVAIDPAAVYASATARQACYPTRRSWSITSTSSSAVAEQINLVDIHGGSDHGDCRGFHRG
jgi:hypothetical protein